MRNRPNPPTRRVVVVRDDDGARGGEATTIQHRAIRRATPTGKRDQEGHAVAGSHRVLSYSGSQDEPVSDWGGRAHTRRTRGGPHSRSPTHTTPATTGDATHTRASARETRRARDGAPRHGRSAPVAATPRETSGVVVSAATDDTRQRPPTDLEQRVNRDTVLLADLAEVLDDPDLIAVADAQVELRLKVVRELEPVAVRLGERLSSPIRARAARASAAAAAAVVIHTPNPPIGAHEQQRRWGRITTRG